MPLGDVCLKIFQNSRIMKKRFSWEKHIIFLLKNQINSNLTYLINRTTCQSKWHFSFWPLAFLALPKSSVSSLVKAFCNIYNLFTPFIYIIYSIYFIYVYISFRVFYIIQVLSQVFLIRYNYYLAKHLSVDFAVFWFLSSQEICTTIY